MPRAPIEASRTSGGGSMDPRFRTAVTEKTEISRISEVSSARWCVPTSGKRVWGVGTNAQRVHNHGPLDSEPRHLDPLNILITYFCNTIFNIIVLPVPGWLPIIFYNLIFVYTSNHQERLWKGTRKGLVLYYTPCIVYNFNLKHRNRFMTLKIFSMRKCSPIN